MRTRWTLPRIDAASPRGCILEGCIPQEVQRHQPESRQNAQRRIPTLYQAKHEALVSKETWDAVQALFDRRVETKQHRIKHDFAFTGFIRCGHCGCGLVGELKKQKYVDSHCTGHRGKCEEPYAREEVMQEQFAAALKELVIPPAVLKWLQESVSEADLNEQAARDREVKRLEEQHRRLLSKLDVLYDDRLEGRISPEMYDRKALDCQNHATTARTPD